MDHHGLSVIHEPQLAHLIVDNQGLILSNCQSPERLGLTTKEWAFTMILFVLLPWSQGFLEKELFPLYHIQPLLFYIDINIYKYWYVILLFILYVAK